MNILKNILTLIGGVTVIGAIIMYAQFGSKVAALDPKAMDLYMAMGNKVLETGNAAEGMIKKTKLAIPYEEGMSEEERHEVKMEAIEEAREIMDAVGEMGGLGRIATSLMSSAEKYGKDQPSKGRYIRINSYCSPTIAIKFLYYGDRAEGRDKDKDFKSMVAFMPCRVGMVEDINGDVWLYTMDMGLLIAGGHTLNDELLAEAKSVESTMYNMIYKAAMLDEEAELPANF